MYTQYYYRSFIDSQFDKRIRLYVSVVLDVTIKNRQDTRRLRFSFFRLQCQTAGNLSAPISDRQFLARFPFQVTGTKRRSLLNFHEIVGASSLRLINSVSGL
jgi:hypothetical protein